MPLAIIIVKGDLIERLCAANDMYKIKKNYYFHTAYIMAKSKGLIE
jgi:hypothetical protein